MSAVAGRWRPYASSARAVFGLIVSAVCLAAVVLWALEQEPPQFPGASAADLLALAAALALYAAITALRGWRWHRILRITGVPHNSSDAYALTVVGYMGNNVLPARGGELLRVFLLGERTTARRREILGSIVAERVLDAGALVALFVALTWAKVAGAPAGQRPALLTVAAIGAAVLALAVYIALRRRGRFERFAGAVRPFVRTTKLLVSPIGMLLAALTISFWCLEGVVCWLIAASLEIELSPVEALLVVVLTSFFAMIPAAPGYVGTLEAGIAFTLSALEVPGGQIVAFAILVRFIFFVPITLVGLLILFTRYGGFRHLRRTAPREATT
jgi:glycosyltransferase 2 family protein